jgi:hypothetical protein
VSDNTPQQPADIPPAPPAPPYPTGPAYEGAYPPKPEYPAAPSYAPPAAHPQQGYVEQPAAQPYGDQSYTQPYAPPPYGYGAAAYPYAPATKTNGLAITSLIAAIASFVVLPFIGSIVAVITGHLALKQLRTSGEAGRGMALAGTIVGWVGVAFGLLFIVFIVIALTAAIGSAGYGYSYS